MAIAAGVGGGWLAAELPVRQAAARHHAEEQAAAATSGTMRSLQQKSKKVIVKLSHGERDVPMPPPLPAPGEDALPPGWSAIAEGEGSTYYYNEDSGVSQWERPQ